MQSGLVQSSSIYSSTLTLKLNSSNGERTLFNLSSAMDKKITPNLKVTVDGEKIPCKVTTVNYNPTLFTISESGSGYLEKGSGGINID